MRLIITPICMNLIDRLKEAISANDSAQERSTVEEILLHLGFSNFRGTRIDGPLLTLVATDVVTSENMFVAVWRKPTQSVDTDTTQQFCAAIEGMNVSGGLFLSIGTLNPRKMLQPISARTVTFMGKSELKRRLESISSFPSESFATPSLFGGDTVETSHEDEVLTPTPAPVFTPKQQESLTPLRNSRKLLRVTFPDGTVFCDKSTSHTFIQVIRHIGIDAVRNVGLVVAHCPLITRNVPPSLTEWAKPVDDEWYVILQSDTDQRHRQLLAINNHLGLGMRIEVGNDLEPLSTTRKKKETRKTKTRLEIILPDGLIINDGRAADTYVSFMKHIGVDKLMRQGLKLSGKSLITSTKQYSDQLLVAPNRWLTVPTSNKLKYRAIKVVASMSHVAVEVKMV